MTRRQSDYAAAQGQVFSYNSIIIMQLIYCGVRNHYVA